MISTVIGPGGSTVYDWTIVNTPKEPTDALAKPIVFGQRYGYSVSQSSRIEVVVAAVLRRGAQMRQPQAPGRARADVAAQMSKQIARAGSVLVAVRARERAAAADIGADFFQGTWSSIFKTKAKNKDSFFPVR